MGYDEKNFKAKANIKARRLWLVFAILLTANYGTDTANGAYSVRETISFIMAATFSTCELISVVISWEEAVWD